ncbi:manganese catalase family protein [Paenibacillus apiarius]|uniref:manganese catalase family protein n=1 Tax=Paenibacillus apiarius TaxID=46240 RepID=UPI002342CF24|nr:manganese catalase family protein [Paenibacillus apiarius]
MQYPVRVSKCDVKMAGYLLEAYGGANGPLSQALCYLNQRYTMPPTRIVKDVLLYTG